MDKETKNLLASVDYDLTTAKHMFDSGRYVYKAPPKTHDLIYLTGAGKIKLSPERLDFIGIINNAGVVTRYPEDLAALIASYPKEIADNYLIRTEEIVRCIKADPRLQG